MKLLLQTAILRRCVYGRADGESANWTGKTQHKFYHLKDVPGWRRAKLCVSVEQRPWASYGYYYGNILTPAHGPPHLSSESKRTASLCASQRLNR